MKKLRCVVFDMEGTLFKKSYRLMKNKTFPSAWAVLCAKCKPKDLAVAEDAANRERYYREEHIPGKYPYSQWVIDTIKIHQKYGMSRRQFYNVINSVEYFDGVTETFETLKEWGVTIAVISGGLKALIDRVAVDHKIEHCFAAAEYFWNRDGTIKHWNVQPTDFVHKRTLLEILCHDLGVKPSECAFVGDGINDCDIARYCGMSIGFYPHKALKEAATVTVDQDAGKEDLRAVLEHLKNFSR